MKNKDFNFDNTYISLPQKFYTKLSPVPVKEPEMVILNEGLASEMGLDFSFMSTGEQAKLFSGNNLPEGAEPLSQAYAGHQFGSFTYLGDGRAHLIGEHISPRGSRFDIQFKGSGKTPYGRRGDGRAAIGPMLREYIISEAMHSLGVLTTRSLAVVTTGEPVYRETVLRGAILTRVASSHLRIGTFEYFLAQRDEDGLKKLADYAIARHYPKLLDSDNPYLDLLKSVMERQTNLVNEWLRIGFIHGVMNTDNMAISGETIDYGPCAFMDKYDPKTVFSSIDHMGRYSYANQPHIVQWNIARFAEALLPLLDKDMEKAISLAEEVIKSFSELFEEEWLSMMRRKFGLFGDEKEDAILISNLLEWMRVNEADYTNTFRSLISKELPEGELYTSIEFRDWHRDWRERLSRGGKPLEASLSLMSANNPVLIPRNHQVELALNAAEERSEYSKFNELYKALREPYKEDADYNSFRNPPKEEEVVHQTFCGT